MAVEHKYFIVCAVCVCVTDVRYHEPWLAVSYLNTILGFLFHELFYTHLLSLHGRLAHRTNGVVKVYCAKGARGRACSFTGTQCIKLKLREITWIEKRCPSFPYHNFRIVFYFICR